MSKGVLVDVTKCIGCGSCVVACKLWNKLKHDPKAQGVGPDAQLAAENWTVVRQVEVQKNKDKVQRFVKMQCLHCVEPACVSACFSRALQKTKEGVVAYNANLCVGCRYCMLACPFNIPKNEWDKAFPEIRKCQMCYSRVEQGESPACIGVCPTGALLYGQRDDLIQQAKEKINGGGYVQHIYGEKEAAGTGWIYISDVPFKELGFRSDLTAMAIPHYTESIMHLTPAIGLGWGAFLTGMYIYTKRRSDIAREEESARQHKKHK